MLAKLLFLLAYCIHKFDGLEKVENDRYSDEVDYVRQRRLLLLAFYHWSNWNAWSHCSETCGVGSRERSRHCLYWNGGATANTHCELHHENANQVEYCYQQACPEAPHWTLWSQWSHCSGSCGSGMKVRIRNCVAVNGPVASCHGDSVEKQTCQHSNSCSVDGTWSSWSSWSPCSHSCGRGTRSRTRSCDGGTSCFGDNAETQGCTMPDCPDIGWSSWGMWTPCSGTCGMGIQIRVRSCSYPNSEYCLGDAMERMGCTHQHDCTFHPTETQTAITTSTTTAPVTKATKTTLATTTTTVSVSCVDHALCFDSNTKPIACRDFYIAASYCPKMCGICGNDSQQQSKTTVTKATLITTTEPACVDHAVCADPTTKTVACNDPYIAASYCSKMCGICGTQ